MVHVYKTNVPSKAALKQLRPGLDALLKGAKWSFDLKDCDKVLRMECTADAANQVALWLRSLGFVCDELP